MFLGIQASPHSSYRSLRVLVLSIRGRSCLSCGYSLCWITVLLYPPDDESLIYDLGHVGDHRDTRIFACVDTYS